MRSWVSRRGQRRKGRGDLFKKQGGRTVSLGVLWGRKHPPPLCLVSNRPPSWNLMAGYQRRYPMEALFRDYKSSGWQWEQGQVTDLEHGQRLRVGMALAPWRALFAGTIAARQILAVAATGGRRTRAWIAKDSLFELGWE